MKNIYSHFLLEIVNIVLRIILFQPFEYQGLIIRLSEMLSNQGHMKSWAKLSSLLDIRLKIAVQIPKTYIYPSFVFYQQLLKTNISDQAKVLYKVRKSGYNIEMYFKQFFTCLERTSTFIIASIFRTIYRSSSL